ncbi:MAG: CAP domain-containing protein, partial [Candidatus Komeilibacteria bacterium]|nr:CAP domain-containing protein [Candidatus Komeilibacteria bacterium]
ISLAGLLAIIIVFLYTQGVLQAKPYQSGVELEQESLIVINKTRLEHNLSQLKINPLLTQAAQNKAADIFEKQYFQHNSPAGKNFSTFIQETGYQANRVGENLAKNINRAPALIQSWLDSPPHRDNLLNPYFQEIGLAVLVGELDHKKTTIVVEMLGEPKTKSKDNF